MARQTRARSTRAAASGLPSLDEARSGHRSTAHRLRNAGKLGRSTPNNLPLPLSSLIGRERELYTLQKLLACERLLTLTGPGGIGKTRLALRLAGDMLDSFPDGVFWVELAPLDDPTFIPRSVAVLFGVQEQTALPLTDTLAQTIAQRTLLLVLDNCEHLIDAAAQLVNTMLRAGPGPKVLVTSREPLHLQGEVIWRVPSLAVPDPLLSPKLDEVAQSHAVQLFIAHAQAVYSGFELAPENATAVAEICERLDGLPLAIELAAARMRVLGVDELRDRLDSRIDVLVGEPQSAPSRHRTLQATLDWSHHLLTPLEQIVFRRLAVFAGGCSLEAIEAVCSEDPITPAEALEILTGLVDKSLVVKSDASGLARFGQLATVRQYAREKLRQAGEEAAIQRRHAEWCLSLVNQAAPHFQTLEEQHWIARLETERNNLRAALTWCPLENSAATEIGLGLLDVLGYVWWRQQQQTEALRWIDQILRLDRGPARHVRVRALNWGAEFATQLGDLQRSTEFAVEALRISREISYAAGEGIALCRLGANSDTRHIHDRGIMLLEEGLRISVESGDSFAISYARYKLAAAYLIEGRMDAATRLIEDSLELATQRADRWGIAEAIGQLGVVAATRGNYSRAARLLEQGLALQPTGARRGRQSSLLELGRVALAQGEPERARKLLGESLQMSRDARNPRQMALCFQALAAVAAMTGQATHAAGLFGAATALGERASIPLTTGPRAAYARSKVTAEKQLGAEAFSSAWDAGRVLPLEHAQSLADEVVDRGGAHALSEVSAGPKPVPNAQAALSSRLGAMRLTRRQRDVLRLVADGLTDRQIAAELVLSEKTVGRHMENIFARLGVSSRAAASVLALREGLT